MPSTTVNAPVSETQTRSTTGYTHIYAAREIQTRIADMMLASPLLQLVGDAAGTGSPTIRATSIGNVGFEVQMTALANEDAAIPESDVVIGYSDITVALYGLAHGETYMHQIINNGRPEAVSLDKLIARVPDSWEKTLRVLTAAQGAAIVNVVGAATTQASIDDLLALIALFRENPGYLKGLPPWGMFHTKQITQILESARSDPAFQGQANVFGDTQGFSLEQVNKNFLNLKFDAHETNDVNTSGGAYQGFVGSPGYMGWVRASTNNIKPSNPQGFAPIPQFGLAIEEIPNGNGKRVYNARFFGGVGLGEAEVFGQCRLISTT